MMRPTQRLGQAGQGLVEFALVLPVILLLLFGVVDFGRAIYAYNTVAEAARQAARLAIVDQSSVDVKDQAIRSAPALGLSGTDVDVCYKSPDTAERSCSNPTVDDCSASLQIGCLAIVVVHAQYSPITPMLRQLVGSRSLSSVSLQPIEYVCPTSSHPSCP